MQWERRNGLSVSLNPYRHYHTILVENHSTNFNNVECKCPTIKIRLWGTHDQKKNLGIWLSESPTPGINSGFTCKGNATFGRTDTARRTFLPLRALICLWIETKISTGQSTRCHPWTKKQEGMWGKNTGNIWGVAKYILFMNSTEVGKKSGITICLDCTCVSKYFGMCNNYTSQIDHAAAILGFSHFDTNPSSYFFSNIQCFDPPSFEQRQQNKILVA